MAKKQFMANKQFNKKGPAFFMAAALMMMVFTTLVATSASAQADTTRPTILSISLSPENNEEDILTNALITVVFSEDMDPSTINENTFLVVQRTTPDSGGYRSVIIDKDVTYANRKATFTPTLLLSPDQQYGNVFTVTITTGVKDLAGNSISRNYVWSFTTGEDPFNTGATTSQQDQSPAGIATVPTSTQPSATGAQAATTSTFPWAWVLGGLLLLLLIAAIFSLVYTRKPVHQKQVQTTGHHPFGDVHPVLDLEGIGPEYNRGLLAMGIKNTKQLWEADAAKVARQTGASLSSVRSWQHMAELASVKDIGPQYAELLERSGVHSIEQLKGYEPKKLLRLVREKEDSLKINIQGNSPGHALVENWIHEARDHRFSASKGETA